MPLLAPWWSRWPARYDAEMAAFAPRGLTPIRDEAAWAAGRLVLRLQFPIADGHNREVSLTVVYPNTFPHTPFEVYATDLALGRHQNPFAGNLCLLPRGSQHWRPSLHAADVVADGVPTLVTAVRAGGETLRAAEEPQGEPISAYLEAHGLIGVVVPDADLDPAVAYGSLTLHVTDDRYLTVMAAGNRPRTVVTSQLLVTRVRSEDGTTLAAADRALDERADGPEWTGNWVRLPSPPSGPSAPDLLAQIEQASPALARRKLANHLAGGAFEVLGAVFTEEVRQGVYADGWAFVLLHRPKGKSGRPLKPVLLRAQRFGPEVLSERIPELARVRAKKAALVGLGSLGAPAALELARAGVGTLALMEPDHVDPGTAVRWPVGLSAATVLKVAVLADRIVRDHPFTTVVPSALRVGRAALVDRATEEADELEGWVLGAGVLIDTTAEENVSRVVNDIGTLADVPQVYAWSVDGYGGVVARVTPGLTGCYHCLSLALADNTIPPPAPPLDGDRLRVQARGCADPTFTGANVDLAPVATQAARLALATLSRSESGAYPDFDDDVLVVQVRDPNGRPIPPRWTGHHLECHPACPLCARP